MAGAEGIEPPSLISELFADGRHLGVQSISRAELAGAASEAQKYSGLFRF